MFESAEVEHAIDKATYDALVPDLRVSLLQAQFERLERRDAAIVVVVGGVDGAGKGDTINLLTSWLDPRHVEVHALDGPTEEEAQRPPYYRYWRRIPPKGKVAIFFGSWHSRPILDRVAKRINVSDMDTALEHVRHFERMLTDEGVILVKLWFHLSKAQQKRRLKALESNALTRWRVTPRDWRHFELYDRFRRVSTRALRETSTDYAPWLIVPGAEPRYRHITVGRAVLAALKAPAMRPSQPTRLVLQPEEPADGVHLLDAVRMGEPMGKKAYGEELELLQGRLSLALRHRKFRDRSLILVFEGWDAAGKGGAIRRVTSALDARSVQVVSIAAPSDEERARPYLWRFWRHLPAHGHVTLFDRSWYGRVLVERVERFCPPSDWMRAYSEINDFEEQLVDAGAVVVKIWLHITAEEQLKRFDERESAGFKRHKITAEDWRNREKWGDYERAVTDMVERTSTELAPWTIVAANDKRCARISVLRSICEALDRRL